MITIQLPKGWDWTLRDHGYTVRQEHNGGFIVFHGSENIGHVTDGVLNVQYPNAIVKAQRVLSVLEGAG